MAQTRLILITTLGTNTGPLFDLYSNADNFFAPFEIDITATALQAGYVSILVPDAATIIRVKSKGVCQTFVDLPIPGITTTTTTTIRPTTTSTTSTTSTTTSSTTTTTTVRPTTTSTTSTTSTTTVRPTTTSTTSSTTTTTTVRPTTTTSTSTTTSSTTTTTAAPTTTSTTSTTTTPPTTTTTTSGGPVQTSNIYVENQMPVTGGTSYARITDVKLNGISVSLNSPYPILPNQFGIATYNNGTYNVVVYLSNVTGTEVVTLSDCTGALSCYSLIAGQTSQSFTAQVLDDTLGNGIFDIILRPGPC